MGWVYLQPVGRGSLRFMLRPVPCKLLIAVCGILAVLAVSGARAPVAAQGSGLQIFSKSVLEIATAAGKIKFSIEIARTPRQQAQGLMFRRRLAADAGMLFLYNQPQIIRMWMKNTFIPLDMIFIGKDGRIVSIAQRTIPKSLETVSSERLASAVLEVNGGTAARLGIRVGDLINHASIGSGVGSGVGSGAGSGVGSGGK